MLVIKGIGMELGRKDITPEMVFYSLRFVMFILSFVLEDWAIHELIQSPRHRKFAVLLVASSYVTWTYQMHTFSNSLETLLVLWSLVMIQRLLDNQVGLLLANQGDFADEVLASTVTYVFCPSGSLLDLWCLQSHHLSSLCSRTQFFSPTTICQKV